MPDDNLPKRVLAVGAHPDDIEILCAGTMALYAQAGSQVTLCTATNGDRGSMTGTPEETAAIRKAAAKNSAEIIGARYVCLDFHDCGLDGASLEVRKTFIDLIREVNPDVVFTHAPEDYHADHLATSTHVWNATMIASVPLERSEHPAVEHTVPVIYMDTLAGIGFTPDSYVDISSAFETKQAMLGCHASQVVWMREQGGFDFEEFTQTVSRFRGFQSGTRYAEAFRYAHAWLRGTTRRLLP